MLQTRKSGCLPINDDGKHVRCQGLFRKETYKRRYLIDLAAQGVKPQCPSPSQFHGRDTVGQKLDARKHEFSMGLKRVAELWKANGRHYLSILRTGASTHGEPSVGYGWTSV
jgi:hypothetical protein